MKALLILFVDILTGVVLLFFNVILFISILACTYFAFDYFVIHHPVNVRTKERIYIAIPDSSNFKHK